MKIRTLVFVVAVLIVINIAALATMAFYRISSPDRRPWHDDFTPRPDRTPLALGRSAEQRRDFRQSIDDLREILEPARTQLLEKRQLLLEEIGEPVPDTILIYSLIEEVGAIQTVIHRKVVDNILENGTILTPEQRLRLIRMIEHDSWGREHRRALQPKWGGRGRDREHPRFFEGGKR